MPVRVLRHPKNDERFAKSAIAWDRIEIRLRARCKYLSGSVIFRHLKYFKNPT